MLYKHLIELLSNLLRQVSQLTGSLQLTGGLFVGYSATWAGTTADHYRHVFTTIYDQDTALIMQPDIHQQKKETN